MTQQDIIGKKFFCTSPYAKNLPFNVTGRYLNDSVTVDTWEGRNCVTHKPQGRVKNAVYPNETVYSMIETGIISETKIN